MHVSVDVACDVSVCAEVCVVGVSVYWVYRKQGITSMNSVRGLPSHPIGTTISPHLPTANTLNNPPHNYYKPIPFCFLKIKIKCDSSLILYTNK